MQSTSHPYTHEPALKRPSARDLGGEMNVSWKAPGPGSWEADGTHFPRPLTHFAGERVLTGFERGFSEGASRYGLPVARFASRLVNRFVYMQPIPFGAGEGAVAPPKLLFLLLTSLHPQMRRRFEIATRAIEQKIWRQDVERWDTEHKPAIQRAHRAIQAVDAPALDNEGLARHLVRCSDHLEEMHRQRHRMSVPALLPVGDFVAHVHAWTGVAFGDIVQCLKGSSPISVGVGARELHALGAAIRSDNDAAKTLASDAEPAALLAELESASSEVSERLAAYIDAVGYRSLGYDIADRFALELPDMLVQAIRASALGGARQETVAGAEDAAARKLRDACPPARRRQFDELLAEARYVYRIRDERGMYTDALACGLARRAVLAAGERLVAQKKLDEAVLAIDASLAELCAMLRGASGPSADELRRRKHWRETKAFSDIPAHLGAEAKEPPPPDWLPDGARRAAVALQTFLACMYGANCEVAAAASPLPSIGAPRGTKEEASAAEVHATTRVIEGLPVSAGIYEGPARVVNDPADFDKIKRGDILVARSTSPYFNVVLPLVGAIITDRGGQLCHAAIVSREYGIPGVVGTRVATSLLTDGARVRVDGGAGRVELL